MQATEKKMNNKIWLSILSVGVVIALVLGIVALVNHGDTKANAIPTINQQVDNIKNTLLMLNPINRLARSDAICIVGVLGVEN